MLAALPPEALRTPELPRYKPGRLAGLLQNLVHRGLLHGAPSGYMLSDTRRDPRFPQVADMFAYQAAQLAESLAAFAPQPAATPSLAPPRVP